MKLKPMRFVNLFLIIILLFSCKPDKKMEIDSLSVIGLLPCEISVNHDTDTLYSIDFDDRVLVVDKRYKPVYNDFKIKDLYPFRIDFKKDSISQDYKAEIEFDIHNFLNLFQDTLKGTFYQIGGYVYHDCSIQNIVRLENSVTFEIKLVRAENLERIVKAELINNNGYYSIKIEKDFIDKLYDKNNPAIESKLDDGYLLRTYKTQDEINNAKLEYYKKQLNYLQNEGSDSIDSSVLNNSIGYLNNLIKVYTE